MKKSLNATIVNELTTAQNNTLSITIFQEGNITKTQKDGNITIDTIKRSDNEVTINTELSNDKFSLQIGNFLNLLLSSNEFLKQQRFFSSKLYLCFEITFNNVELKQDANINLNVRPNFFNSPKSLRKFAHNLTLLFARFQGIHTEFKFLESNVNTIIEGKLSEVLTPKKQKENTIKNVAFKPLNLELIQKASSN
jgi:hypothetical protein